MKKLPAMMALAALLSSCSDGDVREVRDWMEQVKQETRPSVKPLAPPKDFIPFAYEQRDAVDPFNPAKLLAELARVADKSDNPNKPDASRPKELLENYPLDTMRMVGSMQQGGTVYALLQIDKQVHRVKSGQRIGQNFGLVTRVSENAVDIREVVQDAGGDWVARMSKLELQESKESGK
ncbi:MAG TPA: pilus assembly protein PilP [Telluria sp.]|nr:pilus assembly protein PilP [Telluria sp.]